MEPPAFEGLGEAMELPALERFSEAVEAAAQRALRPF